ncbi:sensor histidine kinase [Sphingobacterium spiritivorum]|nr:HAMP domain-containing sensor histidine kinase [Sphingobacterium spiritivorum]QQS94772.1 HAMP domain-containing histidine kinase [Sphingobacterium spiritivorum]
MRLLNRTMLYLSGALLLILSVWAVIFYLDMMDEVYDSLDDGLENHKMLIIHKAYEDEMVYQKRDFGESNYRLIPVPEDIAISGLETYSDTSMYMVNEEDFEVVRMLTTYFQDNDGKYYKLQVISSMVEEDDLISSLLYSLLTLFVVVMISIFIINKLILSKIWKPFYQLGYQLKKFELGKRNTFVAPKTSVLEFKELNNTIIQLLDDNTAVYERQKDFVENAAHELQTPLAISQSKVEMLLPHFEKDEEVLNQLAEVLHQLDRMKRLNKSLLLLTKIDNRQFLNQEPTDFNMLWRKQIEAFRELLEHKSIHVDLSEEEVLILDFNPDLAQMLISNLLRNAHIHNYEGGHIVLRIRKNGFTIANTGKEMALNTQHIFDRFYKDVENQQSTGLGLAIVRSIVDSTNGHIDYTYTDHMHSFTVHFD